MSSRTVLAVPAIVLVLTGVIIYVVISGPRRQIAGHGDSEHAGGVASPGEHRDTVNRLSDEGEKFIITAEYPRTGTPFIDNAVAAFVQEQADSFRTETSGLPRMDSLKYPLHITYAMTSFQDTIIGIRFDVYKFLGGAHGQTRISTLIIDSLNARMLTLDDLFEPATHYLDTFATLCRTRFSQLLGERADPSWIERGTAPTPEIYSRTLPSPEGLRIVFEAYAVAPGAMGSQEITLPWAEIVSLLRPQLRDRMRAEMKDNKE